MTLHACSAFRLEDQRDEEAENNCGRNPGAGQFEHARQDPDDTVFLRFGDGPFDQGVAKAQDRHGRPTPGEFNQPVIEAEAAQDAADHR